MASKTWTELLWSCCASPCTDDRVEGSAFCKVHKAEHAKSTYPAHLRVLMDAVKAGKKR